jgi:hypothetical protein
LGFRGPWETPEPQERERPGLRPSPSTSGNLLGFRGPRENARATRARASGAPPMHPQDWTKFSFWVILGGICRRQSQRARASLPPPMHLQGWRRTSTCTSGRSGEVGFFVIATFLAPQPNNIRPVLFQVFFLLKSKSSSILQGCVDPGLLALVPRVRTRDTTDSSSSSSAR